MLYVLCVLLACLFADSDASYRQRFRYRKGNRNWANAPIADEGYPYYTAYAPYEQMPPLPTDIYGGYEDFLIRFAGYKNRMEGRQTTNELFKGPNLCQETTEARPKLDSDFELVGYVCVCKKGYYLPKKDRQYGGYYDAQIEKSYAMGKDLSRYKCIPCRPAGCTECVNEKVCVSWRQNNYQRQRRRY